MIETTFISARSASMVRRFVPILSCFPGYRRNWLMADVLAGLAVWAVMVPEGMAYAGIVGVPPIMGLYTIVPPLIPYSLLGASGLLVVGPASFYERVTDGVRAWQGQERVDVLSAERC